MPSRYRPEDLYRTKRLLWLVSFSTEPTCSNRRLLLGYVAVLMTLLASVLTLLLSGSDGELLCSKVYLLVGTVLKPPFFRC